jgi:hypothetical protein
MMSATNVIYWQWASLLLRLGYSMKVSVVTCFNKVRYGRIYGNGAVTNTAFTYIFKVFT